MLAYFPGEKFDAATMRRSMERSIELVGQRLILREFTPDDWPAVHVYGSDPEVVCFQLWGPNDEEQIRAFVRMAMAERTGAKRTTCNLAIVLKDENLLIGGCHLQLDAKTARQGDFGYCLRRSHWGHGYASEASRAAARFRLRTAWARAARGHLRRPQRALVAGDGAAGNAARGTPSSRPAAKRPMAQHAGLCHHG